MHFAELNSDISLKWIAEPCMGRDGWNTKNRRRERVEC